MAYGTFKTLEEVLIKFDLESQNIEFLDKIGVSINDFYFELIQKNLKTQRSYISENSICESIIYPVLSTISDRHNLPVWSHIKFDVSPEDGLTGIPDFLLAPISKTGVSFTKPVVCVAEAKKDNFEEGWTQTLSEMIAAQRFNNNTKKIIYGITTSGEIWKFGKLVEKQFIIDPIAYSAPMDLQKLFDVLNWFIIEAKKEL